MCVCAFQRPFCLEDEEQGQEQKGQDGGELGISRKRQGAGGSHADRQGASAFDLCRTNYVLCPLMGRETTKGLLLTLAKSCLGHHFCLLSREPSRVGQARELLAAQGICLAHNA